MCELRAMVRRGRGEDEMEMKTNVSTQIHNDGDVDAEVEQDPYAGGGPHGDIEDIMREGCGRGGSVSEGCGCVHLSLILLRPPAGKPDGRKEAAFPGASCAKG